MNSFFLKYSKITFEFLSPSILIKEVIERAFKERKLLALFLKNLRKTYL